MRMALSAKNKLGFIDDTLSMSNLEDNLAVLSWNRCNNMILSWIINVVIKEIAESLLYMDSVVEAWNNLYDRFHQSNGPRVFQI